MLWRHAQENLNKPKLINTLQGVAADLIPNQPDLAAPIRDLINKPLFLSTLRQIKPGAALAQRDALIDELSRIYTPETLHVFHQILGGFLGIPDEDAPTISTDIADNTTPENNWEQEHQDQRDGSYLLNAEDLGLHAINELHPPSRERWAAPAGDMEADTMDPKIFGHNAIYIKAFGYLDDIAEILKVPVGYIIQWCNDNAVNIGNPDEPIDFETANYIHNHYKPSRFRRITKILALTSCFAAIAALVIAAITK